MVRVMGYRRAGPFSISNIGITELIYRDDINVDSKRNEVKAPVRLLAEDNDMNFIDNSVIDNSILMQKVSYR